MRVKIINCFSIVLMILALEAFFFFLSGQYLSTNGRTIILNLLSVALGLEMSLIIKEVAE